VDIGWGQEPTECAREWVGTLVAEWDDRGLNEVGIANPSAASS